MLWWGMGMTLLGCRREGVRYYSGDGVFGRGGGGGGGEGEVVNGGEWLLCWGFWGIVMDVMSV